MEERKAAVSFAYYFFLAWFRLFNSICHIRVGITSTLPRQHPFHHGRHRQGVFVAPLL